MTDFNILWIVIVLLLAVLVAGLGWAKGGTK